MPNKSERRKHRAFRRSAKETRMYTKGKKHKKLKCALCEKNLHGVPHGASRSVVAKISKSQRRPTGAFGGILCNQCKKMIMSESVKVKSRVKKMDNVNIEIRPYIKQVSVN